MCDQGWDPEDAKVACTQLGYPLLASLFYELDLSELPYITNVDCAGDEATLDDCAADLDTGNCTGSAGVLCFHGRFM